MKSDVNAQSMTARQFLMACTTLLGSKYMHKLYNVSKRCFYTWIADKKYVGGDSSIRENYIEKHEELLKELMTDPDGIEIARALTARHASLTGCEIIVKDIITPDKETIEQECLDDYPALTRLHTAISDKKSHDLIEHLGRRVKQEIDETVVSYKSCEGV